MFLRSFHMYALFDWFREYTGTDRNSGSNIRRNANVQFTKQRYFSRKTCSMFPPSQLRVFWQQAACLVSNARRNLFFNFEREKIYVSQDTFKMPLFYNFSPGNIVFSSSNKLCFATDFELFIKLLYFLKKSHFASQFEQVTLESTAQHQHIRRTIDFLSSPF